MRPNDLIGNELSRVPVQRERRLPDGSTVVSSVCQKIWVEPYAGGKTPMYHALTECYRLCKAWCGAKAHRKSYPPTIFNITDGESSDGDDFKLQEIADSIKATLYRGRCCAADQYPHLFRCGAFARVVSRIEKELPDQRYARLLYDMSSEMPAIYNESIVQLRGRDGERFRGSVTTRR